MSGAQNPTYELAVTNNEYFGFSSAEVIASDCIDRNSATFLSRSKFPSFVLPFL